MPTPLLMTFQVLCISTRLAPQAIYRLILATEAHNVLLSPQLDSKATEAMSFFEANGGHGWAPAIKHAPPYAVFLDETSGLCPTSKVPACRYVNPFERNAVILHSSGTTGLPKPIYHTHAYLLGYAACHKLSEHDVNGSMNVSTLPLFHVNLSLYHLSRTTETEIALIGFWPSCTSIIVVHWIIFRASCSNYYSDWIIHI